MEGERKHDSEVTDCYLRDPLRDVMATDDNHTGNAWSLLKETSEVLMTQECRCQGSAYRHE